MGKGVRHASSRSRGGLLELQRAGECRDVEAEVAVL